MKRIFGLKGTPLEGCEHVSTERIRGVTCEQKRDNIYIGDTLIFDQSE